MPVDRANADLTVSLPLDVNAPRAARLHVRGVDRPSPDLRDVVVLLTSELVTRAVDSCSSDQETLELSVWMPSDVVRVEIRAPHAILGRPRPVGEIDYELLLVRQLADRWSEDRRGDRSQVWFEIDRRPTPAASLAGANSAPVSGLSGAVCHGRGAVF
jgi:hypothetical protein